MNGIIKKFNQDPRLLNGLTLAFMGDAVLDVYIRTHLIAQGMGKPNRLHRQATRYVSAKAQAYVVKELYDRFNEDERDMIKRGRNAKSPTVPKHTEVTDYRLSTGFECLLGYHYLAGNEDRLLEIMNWFIEAIDRQSESTSVKQADKEGEHK